MVIYFDDSTVHSTFEEHVEHVRFVLKKIKDAQLRLKSSKCRWYCRKAKILGHIISEGQIAMDESKVDLIKNREPSRNDKHIQQFLGLCNYYRRFVKDYAKIASPITELLKGDGKFVWGKRQQFAFEQLKNALVSYPILRQHNFALPFIIYTDASG